MKATYLRLGATLLLLLAIGLEVNHSFIRQVAWKGFEPAANFASIPLIAAWMLAIAGLWSANALLKPWLILGIFFLVMHGVVISTGGNGLGAAYLFSGLLAAICASLAHNTGAQDRPQMRSRDNLQIAS